MKRYVIEAHSVDDKVTIHIKLKADDLAKAVYLVHQFVQTELVIDAITEKA